MLQVRLLSDFSYKDIPFTLPTESSKAALGADEYNLLYVALTRFTLLYTAKLVLTFCVGPRRTLSSTTPCSSCWPAGS